MTPRLTYSDDEAIAALVRVLPHSKWEVAALARGLSRLRDGADPEEAARVVFETGPQTLKASREALERSNREGLLGVAPERTRTGSAENPITKLIPATLTETRFSEELDRLRTLRPTVEYSDDRQSGHSLTDFTLRENDGALPLNVKNAGTRFYNAAKLVGLDPGDCVPIPAYKAHGAVSTQPSLIYAVCADYQLLSRIDAALPTILTRDEAIVWDLLTKYHGAQVRNAEDLFIFGAVKAHWEDKFRMIAGDLPFHVISARKAIRILQTKPERTPGIGLRAWGTGASAEVNVHVSVNDDMTPWTSVSERILAGGIADIVEAVNRRRQEWVYDPEI